jgi:hypothetical protein
LASRPARRRPAPRRSAARASTPRRGRTRLRRAASRARVRRGFGAGSGTCRAGARNQWAPGSWVWWVGWWWWVSGRGEEGEDVGRFGGPGGGGRWWWWWRRTGSKLVGPRDHCYLHPHRRSARPRHHTPCAQQFQDVQAQVGQAGGGSGGHGVWEGFGCGKKGEKKRARYVCARAPARRALDPFLSTTNHHHRHHFLKIARGAARLSSRLSVYTLKTTKQSNTHNTRSTRKEKRKELARWAAACVPEHTHTHNHPTSPSFVFSFRVSEGLPPTGNGGFPVKVRPSCVTFHTPQRKQREKEGARVCGDGVRAAARAPTPPTSPASVSPSPPSRLFSPTPPANGQQGSRSGLSTPPPPYSQLITQTCV